MKKIIVPLLLLTLLSLFSCGNRYVLSPDEMEELLVDLHLAEGLALQSHQFKSNTSKLDLYTAVYDKHNTNKAQFDSSMIYYSENLTDLGEIYDNVFDRIVNLESQVEQGQFAATKLMVDKASYAHIVADDIDLLPYISNELWSNNRTFTFVEKDFDKGKALTFIVDTLLNRQMEMRFTIETDSLSSAICKVEMLYATSDNESKTFELPLDSTQLVTYNWSVSNSPDTLKFTFTAKKSGDKAVLKLSDCRIYDLSDVEHNIYLFRE